MLIPSWYRSPKLFPLSHLLKWGCLLVSRLIVPVLSAMFCATVPLMVLETVLGAIVPLL